MYLIDQEIVNVFNTDHQTNQGQTISQQSHHLIQQLTHVETAMHHLPSRVLAMPPLPVDQYDAAGDNVSIAYPNSDNKEAIALTD